VLGPPTASHRLLFAPVLGALLAGCPANEENVSAKARIWGNEKVSTESEKLAAEKLDPRNLADRATLTRVLNMTFEEVVLRMGFVEYTGTAVIDVSRGGQNIRVTEESLIEQGLHGGFRVLQKDRRGEPTREGVHHNGIFFIRNGTGEMRVQGIVKDQHITMRQEAWAPLSTFTGYFGERVGAKATGGTSHEGRPAEGYDLVLLDGPELIKAGKDKPKKPVLLKGKIKVDAETAVVLMAELTAKLDVPHDKGDPGHVEATLRSSLKTVEGKEIKPGEFVPTIKRHPTDLDPLAFLSGDTRTSTVIGGPKKKAKTPPTKPPADAKPADAKPADDKPAEAAPAPKTTTPKAKKKKRRKKRRRKKKKADE